MTTVPAPALLDGRRAPALVVGGSGWHVVAADVDPDWVTAHVADDPITGSDLVPAWHIPGVARMHAADLLWAVAAGVVGALIAVVFTYLTLGMRWLFRSVPAAARPIVSSRDRTRRAGPAVWHGRSDEACGVVPGVNGVATWVIRNSRATAISVSGRTKLSRKSSVVKSI